LSAVLYSSSDRIGVVTLNRPEVHNAFSDEVIVELTALFEKAGADKNVRAVVLRVDSPGGSVAGGEGLHDAIARVALKKPVVAVMGGTAASAGYMVAVPAARIFAVDSVASSWIARPPRARSAGSSR